MSFLPTEGMIVGTSKTIADIAGLAGHSLSNASLINFSFIRLHLLSDIVTTLVVNRKSFGRNRKRAIHNPQFRPNAETAERGLFRPKVSFLGRMGPLSAERAVIFQPK